MLQRFQWSQGKGFLLGEQILSQENKPNRSVVQKGILVDKPWKLRLNVVTVLVSRFCFCFFFLPNFTRLFRGFFEKNYFKNLKKSFSTDILFR